MTGERDRIRAAQRTRDFGQASILLVLMLSAFLLAVLAFAVDYTNIWFQRQQVQTAADAACQAGAMDIFEVAGGTSLPNMGFVVGTAGDCNAYSSPGPTMCWYAAKNGFNGYTGGPADVSWSFPTSVSGVTPPPSVQVPYPFLQVKVTLPVKNYFSTLLTGNATQPVGAIATCAVSSIMGSDMILVLAPSGNATFNETGGGTKITVVGGSPRGIQVNSTSTTAVVMSGGSTADLSKGGPNFTGSSFGITGGPTSQLSGYSGGTTGHWMPSDSPVANPFTGLAPPASVKLITPKNGTAGTNAAYQTDGCPNHSGCVEFWPGYYPSGINVGSGKTALVNVGIYYMDGDLKMSGGATLRPALGTTGQLQTDGMMFYFHSGTVNLSAGNGGTLDSTPSTALTCDGNVPNPSLGIPSGLQGHVLFGQCTRLGTYYDSAGDTSDGLGALRGLVFFQDPSNSSTSPTLSGGSGMALAGNIYLHNNSNNAKLTISGGSGVFSGTWGSIVVDEMTVSGGSGIQMLENTHGSIPVMKVALVQ